MTKEITQAFSFFIATKSEGTARVVEYAQPLHRLQLVCPKHESHDVDSW